MSPRRPGREAGVGSRGSPGTRRRRRRGSRGSLTGGRLPGATRAMFTSVPGRNASTKWRFTATVVNLVATSETFPTRSLDRGSRVKGRERARWVSSHRCRDSPSADSPPGFTLRRIDSRVRLTQVRRDSRIAFRDSAARAATSAPSRERRVQRLARESYRPESVTALPYRRGSRDSRRAALVSRRCI